jgi:hypothetical protein
MHPPFPALWFSAWGFPTGTDNFLIPPHWLAKSQTLHKLSTSQQPHFCPEDGDSMFLRNMSIYLQVHMALQPRRQTSTCAFMISVQANKFNVSTRNCTTARNTSCSGCHVCMIARMTVLCIVTFGLICGIRNIYNSSDRRHPDIRVKHCAYGHSVATLLNPRGVTRVPQVQRSNCKTCNCGSGCFFYRTLLF